MVDKVGANTKRKHAPAQRRCQGSLSRDDLMRPTPPKCLWGWRGGGWRGKLWHCSIAGLFGSCQTGATSDVDSKTVLQTKHHPLNLKKIVSSSSSFIMPLGPWHVIDIMVVGVYIVLGLPCQPRGCSRPGPHTSGLECRPGLGLSLPTIVGTLLVVNPSTNTRRR